MFHANSIQRSAEVKTKLSLRQKFLQDRDKSSIHQEDITSINIYSPNNRAPNIYEANSDRIEGRSRQFINNSWRPQYLTFNNV